MVQEIGESREAWGHDVMKMAEDFAKNMKAEVKPFYIVYAAKPDRVNSNRFYQTIKAYFNRPPPLIGILVWYVDNAQGIFEFIPELSLPPDVPLDERLLSTNPDDAFTGIMERGAKANVLLS